MTDATLSTDFAGRRGRVFWLSLRASLLTLLTLGIYRFWMKTRLRRYYWSSVRPGGTPLEYVGEPSEKLLGFLMAVCVMAFYIGIVNLILMFFSFALFNGNVAAYALSFLGLVPIYFYARYRARRYVVARTRWRGIRFGVDQGAWGYAVRVMWHFLLAVLTLGLLWPRMTFYLEKYRTDRTWFGSVPLVQGGRWVMLIPPMLHVWIPVAVAAGLLVAVSIGHLPEDALLGLILPVLWALYGLVRYNVVSWRKLTETKRAAGLRLDARPRTGRVLRIYILGGLALIAVLLAILTGFGTAVYFLVGSDIEALIFDMSLTDWDVPTWLTAAAGVAVYFTFFLAWGVLRHVFFTLPLWQHYAETLSVTGAAHLAAVAQRGRDEFEEAEGFAETLDFGGGL